jgi:hypothetical protein
MRENIAQDTPGGQRSGSIWTTVRRWLVREHPHWFSRDPKDSYGQLVREGVRCGMGRAQLVAELSLAMYQDAIGEGAGESDIGLFGPRLYRHVAAALVDSELARN